VIAGGGVAPHESAQSVRAYRPAFGPSVVLSALAILLAQPGQLPLWRAQLEPVVRAHRAALVRDHDRQTALTRTSAGSAVVQPGAEPAGAYRARIEAAAFLALRLQAIWREPQRAFALSFAFWFLVLLPTFAGRYLALSALRDYEQLRWRAARLCIEREAHGAHERSEARLGGYTSYAPRAPRSPASTNGAAASTSPRAPHRSHCPRTSTSRPSAPPSTTTSTPPPRSARCSRRSARPTSASTPAR